MAIAGALVPGAYDPKALGQLGVWVPVSGRTLPNWQAIAEGRRGKSWLVRPGQFKALEKSKTQFPVTLSGETIRIGICAKDDDADSVCLNACFLACLADFHEIRITRLESGGVLVTDPNQDPKGSWLLLTAGMTQPNGELDSIVTKGE
jgi:hypothetical protein